MGDFAAALRGTAPDAPPLTSSDDAGTLGGSEGVGGITAAYADGGGNVHGEGCFGFLRRDLHPPPPRLFGTPDDDHHGDDNDRGRGGGGGGGDGGGGIEGGIGEGEQGGSSSSSSSSISSSSSSRRRGRRGLASRLLPRRTGVWIGRSSVSSLHFDNSENFFAQVVNRSVSQWIECNA